MTKKFFILTCISFLFVFANAQQNIININYIDELKLIGNNADYPLNGNYKLLRDLDFSDPNSYFDLSKMPYFTSGQWNGIGPDNNDVINYPFSGIFDGNNHIIKNFYSTGNGSIGLFRSTYNATIKNIGMVNIKIENAATLYFGGISSRATSSNFNNCFVTGSMFTRKNGTTFIISDGIMGGIIGYSIGNSLTNCYTNVDMGSNFCVGGLIGRTEKFNQVTRTIIKNCFTAGKLEILNTFASSFIIGNKTFNNNQEQSDSILNTYTVSSIKSNTTDANNRLVLGGSYYTYTTNIDTFYVKGFFSLNSIAQPFALDFRTQLGYTSKSPNDVLIAVDTVFSQSASKNFAAITTAAYNNTYLYSASNQQYPLLYRSDTNALLDGQRAVYPAVIEKNLGSFSFSDSVKPIDNFTKNGNTRYRINNINGVNDNNQTVFSYFSLNNLNGTLNWIENIPNGDYLVEIGGTNGNESSRSWIRISIIRSLNAISTLSSQSIQFTTKDSTANNGDYIYIDTLNLIGRNYTIETWAKFENNYNRWRRVFDFGTGSNYDGVLLGFPNSTQLGFHSNNGIADQIISLPAGFNPLNWNHYALTQSDSLRLYLNGTLIATTAGKKISVGLNKNYIGRSNWATDTGTTGRFRDFRIWIKAHTTNEIKSYYNQQIPINADSLYVYLPLNSNIYGKLPNLNDNIGNYSNNVFGQKPYAYYRRNKVTSIYQIYDSNKQELFGTLSTKLADNEMIQIALNDSTNWLNVQNVSNYNFNYTLPANFITGNIFVRSVINNVPTTRFGSSYAASKYYVDWVGTEMRINPNLPYIIKYGHLGTSANTPSILIQRNKNKIADTLVSPIVGTFTNAPQSTYITPYNDGYRYLYRNGFNRLNIFINVYYYQFQSDYSFTGSLFTYSNLQPIDYLKFIPSTNTSSGLFIFKNNTPTGIYTPIFGYNVLNSLNQASYYFNPNNNSNTNNLEFNIVYSDSLKAVIYDSTTYRLTAFKTSATTAPKIVGNDSVVTNTRFFTLVRRNGQDVSSYYNLNGNNFVLTTANRPVGTDSVFLTFVGLFEEAVKDTLIFKYQYTKPKIVYPPNNQIKVFPTLNTKFVSPFPFILDSGGAALTYNLINPSNGATIDSKSGVISIPNISTFVQDSNYQFSVRVTNGSVDDTIQLTFTKPSPNNSNYYSNSSYRTVSSGGNPDYIQLPTIDLRNKAFGMDVWYKHNAQNGVWHRIFDIGTGANNQGVLIAFPDATKIIVRTPGQSDTFLTIPANINIRQWNHYAVSVNSSGKQSFYWNGKLFYTRTGGGTTPQNIFTSSLIGKTNYGGIDAPSEGQFTDFRIWDNTIDSTIYNIRGINSMTTNSGANLIFYLPLSLPVYFQNIPVVSGYALKNQATINSPAILDSFAFIRGNSNIFNFDQDRLFLSGLSTNSITDNTKKITATTYNYTSATDTANKITIQQTASVLNNYYYGILLPAQQGSPLNNQNFIITDSLTSSGTGNNYFYKINLLPDYFTYLPGDTIKIQFGNAGYTLPRTYLSVSQTPFKYTLVNSGTLNNLISVDQNSGKLSWTNTVPTGIYPIQVNVTNIAGEILMNAVVVVSDSLKSIQYSLDSLSVLYGTDSSNLPFTTGNNAFPTYSISSAPFSSGISINPQNGRIYWNTLAQAGIYTLTIKASNLLNTIYKTIKLNIRGIAPSALAYSPQINNFINSGYDTSYVRIKANINSGGLPLNFSANLPAGFRFEQSTGDIVARLDSIQSGNFSVIVTATNAATQTPNFSKDTISINVKQTSKDTIIGFKNSYISFNTDASGTSGDYINLPNISLPYNYTIETWAKLTNINRYFQRLFEAGKGSNSNLITIGLYGTTGKLFFSIPTDSVGTSKLDVADNQVRIANNTWFHIAMVKNGTNVKLYLNGIKIIDSNVASRIYKDTLTNVAIARSNYPGDATTLGQMDEIRIWNKALTAQEISRYRSYAIIPTIDSLLLYLPLNSSLFVDSIISNNSTLMNKATGKDAWNITAIGMGNGLKFMRDSNRQILYGTLDTASILNNTIKVRTRFSGQFVSGDSVYTALKNNYLWATDYKTITNRFTTGSFTVTKSVSNDTLKPIIYYVGYTPKNIFYNINNSFKIRSSDTNFYSNSPTVQQNLDPSNLVYSINPTLSAISINPTTGVIRINADSALKLYGKQLKFNVTATNRIGSTSSEINIYLVSANIIGFNNTSVALPNLNGSDYIQLPTLDLRNSNFAVETWFKLSGIPTNYRRIFDFGINPYVILFILYFNNNQLLLDVSSSSLNLGNADTVLKNGLNAWNKFSIYYQVSNKTFYVYINGIYKTSLTVASDYFSNLFVRNFLAKSNFSNDPNLEGSYREFRIYKNLSYDNFKANLKYSLVPNRTDANLYYYYPLSNNTNSYTFFGKKNLLSNTIFTNQATLYNKNAPEANAILYSDNNQTYYFGDSLNQFIEGEFLDNKSNLRFSFNQGQVIDTVLPDSNYNYVWRLNVKNFLGKFKVYNANNSLYSDSINVLSAPEINYSINNQLFTLNAGQSVKPNVFGSDTIFFSLVNNTINGFSINIYNGIIYWTNQIPAGLYNLSVVAMNKLGTDTTIYTFNLQDSLKGFAYVPNMVQGTGYTTDSLQFLPSFTQGSGATYRILPPFYNGFGINATNGRINWTNIVPNGVYTIRVEANNAFNAPVVDTITITLVNQAPSNLQYYKDSMEFKQGEFFSTPRPNINSGGLTINYRINNIVPLTNNISIDSTSGIIKWTSDVVGSYTITVRASNSLGSILKTININIIASTNIVSGYTNGSLNIGNGNSAGISTGNLYTYPNRVELPSFDFRNSDYTIETWAKVLFGIGATNWRRIFDFGTGPNSQGVLLGFPSYGNIGFHCNSSDVIIPYPLGFNPNNWNHYAITLSDSARFYINGVLVKTAVGNRANLIYDKNYINFSNYSNDLPGLNAYKEFRVWKTVRAANDINQSYQSKINPNILGLYYYLPLDLPNYLPGDLKSLPNAVAEPGLGNYNYSGNIIGTYYSSKFANTALNSNVRDSAKIIFVKNSNTNEYTSNYYFDSTQQRIYGNYAGTLNAGEVLQYSLDTGRTWKNITYTQNYTWNQLIDNNFKYGIIKVRSAINNVATSRVFNDLKVQVYPKSPIIGNASINNNGTVNLSFTPSPIQTGVSSYKVYTSTGELVATTTVSPVVISNLNQGQAYQFKVTAVNSFGESPESGLSNGVTPLNVLLQIITFTNNPAGVSLTPTNNEANPYLNYRVTYQLNTGYKIDSIVIDNVKRTDSVLGGFTFFNVNASHIFRIYVSKITFSIFVTTNSGGIVNQGQSTISVGYGDTSIIKIFPNNRFKIDSVFINGTYFGTINIYSFNNVTQNQSVRVVFKAITYYTINVDLAGNGNVSPLGLAEVAEGTNYTIKYNPAVGSLLDSVLVNGVLVNDSTSSYSIININRNTTVRIVFKLKTYTISSSVKNGTISPLGTNTYTYGSNISFNYTSTDTTYVLDSLIIDGKLQINPNPTTYSFNILDSNHSIRVVFNLKANINYTIFISSSVGGSLTPSTDQQVNYGGTLRVSWVPTFGYLFDSLFVNGVYNKDSVNAYTFTNIKSVSSIYVKFKIQTFTIVASAGVGGGISPQGTTTVNYGSSQIYTITVDAGYLLDSLLINGVKVNNANNYTFSNVTANQTIRVTFKLINNLISSIQVSPISCFGNVDGRISIVFSQNLSQRIQIVGGAINKDTTISGANYTLTNLDSGRYAITITTTSTGKVSNFVARITAPAPITGYSSYDPQRKELTLNMSGANDYKVKVNGKIVATSTNSQINIPLSSGLNKISVESEQTCLGTYQEDVLVESEITTYPNPTAGKFTIDLGEPTNQPTIEIIVNDINGVEVLRRNIEVEKGQKLNVDLSKFSTGIYLIRVGNKLGRIIVNY